MDARVSKLICAKYSVCVYIGSGYATQHMGMGYEMVNDVDNSTVKSFDHCKCSATISKLVKNDKRISRKGKYKARMSDKTLSHETDHSDHNLSDIFRRIKIGNYVKCNSRVIYYSF